MDISVNTQNFKGLTVAKNISKRGMKFIDAERSVLEKLSTDVDVVIKQGTEYHGCYSGPCLDVTVKPLIRSKNPIKRLFNLDCASGKFETELRNIRDVNKNIATLVNRLRGELPDSCFHLQDSKWTK